MRGASNYSTLATASGNLTLTVASGEPVWVHGILINNRTSGATTAIIYEGDGSTKITGVELAANSTVSCDTTWLADKGIAITASGISQDITVFHDNPGN